MSKPSTNPNRKSSRKDEGAFVGAELVEYFEQRLPHMTEDLAALVAIESPSNGIDALRTCASYLAPLGTSLLGHKPEKIEVKGRVHLLWKFGSKPRTVLVGHYDTVHPVGTVAQFPFSAEGDIARGPGVCDMKGGIVIATHALHLLVETFGAAALDGICLFLNADEEIGSPTSLATILELADSATTAIGFENAGENGEVKVERRGRSSYELRFAGRAAHAGVAPERGVNALHELCNQFAPVLATADEAAGTSVNPTMATAGETYNTIPDRASMWVDVRVSTRAEQLRVDDAMRALQPTVAGATIEVLGEMQQPPMSPEASADLYRMAAEVSAVLGLGPLPKIAVGGSADTCWYAHKGLRTIDGFGAVGGDDHSTEEWIDLGSLARRAALTAGTIAEVHDLPLVSAGAQSSRPGLRVV